MAATPPPSHWLLIAVLSSNLPLQKEVSLRLYQAAYRLHHSQDSVEKLQGDLLTGKVTRLGSELALGTVTGPAFEATISTAQGEGVVRFLLTRQGLELADEAGGAGTSSVGDMLPPAKSGGWVN